jgi:hypothetical protein
VPLSEDEQRILQEIEQQFYEHDPAFAHNVGSTTLYRHAGRNLKWAALGFLGGFVVLIASFASSWMLGIVGFLAMFGCATSERWARRAGSSGRPAGAAATCVSRSVRPVAASATASVATSNAG